MNGVSELFQSHMLQPMSDAQVGPVLELIQYIHKKYEIDPKLQEIYQQGIDGRSLDSVYEEISGLKKSSVAGATWDDPYSFKKDKRPPSFSSGLAWFDGLIGGGFIHGEAYSLIAPTGGGKSTIVGQLACALAIQGRKVLVWMTEQGFDEHRVKAKYWSVISGVPYETFLEYESPSDIPDDVVSPETKEIVKKTAGSIICLDKRHITTMAQLRSIIASQKPDVVFIDWAGTLADILMQAKDNSFRGDRPLCLRAIANETNTIAKDFKVAAVVLHQLGTHIKNPFHAATHLDSFECKSFSHSISFGLVLWPRDANNITKIACTKSRYGDIHAQVIVRLDGANAKFEHMTGYKKGRGKWVPEGAPELGELPGKKPEVAVASEGFR
jgi:hypothetical protein